jgi:hypothetical protein
MTDVGGADGLGEIQYAAGYREILGGSRVYRVDPPRGVAEQPKVQVQSSILPPTTQRPHVQTADVFRADTWQTASLHFPDRD